MTGVDSSGTTAPRSTIRTHGISHVAVLTHDLDPLVGFYTELFGARLVAELEPEDPIGRHCLIDVGGPSMLHLIEVPGVEIPSGPLFGRGRLDHLALSVPDVAALHELRDRLVDAGASSGEVTDLGVVLSVHFRDPGGMDAEITCLKHSDPATGSGEVDHHGHQDHGRGAVPDGGEPDRGVRADQRCHPHG